MEKKQLSKLEELAIEAYRSPDVCDKWKDRIKAAQRELFKKEDGWYTSFDQSNKYCAYFVNEKERYGHTWSGAWFTKDSGVSITACVKATDGEIETTLIKEAEKRGVKIGDYVANGIHNTSHASNPIRSFRYFSFKDSLETDLGCIIYEKGVWIRDIKRMTITDLLKLAEKTTGSTVEIKL